MRKAKQTIDLFLKFKELIGAVAVAALWILNIWFGYKFAPIAQDYKNLDARVSANEIDIGSIGNDVGIIKTDVIEVRCFLMGDRCLD